MSSALTTPPQYHAVGIALAIGSGVLIGSSFVFKKKGLLASQGDKLGEGVAYLKNPVWWTGMTMMILGELCNFGAYAFVAAIIVTPMGALSVVICAILSSIFLKERLTLIGWIGCGQCIVGSVIIALNAPEQQSANTIKEFKALFLAPGFLAYGSVVIASALVIIFFFAPKYGKGNMLWYISVCSLIGGLSVSCTQGLGSCIVTSIRGESQFKNWFIYFLIAFVAVTLVTEIYFLNMALALFNTAMVTPIYFTFFTTCTLVTSLVLYQGVKASASQIVTVFLGFVVICSGVSLLQLSKVDPTHLTNLDRRTTLLLQAAREEVDVDEQDPEKGFIAATEEPGIDAMRGGFGGLGTITRARRRQSVISGDDGSLYRRFSTATSAAGEDHRGRENLAGRGVRRFQLHDASLSPRAPPSSYHPDGLLGRKKRRDSHDSAAAVQGSVHGDHPRSPNGNVPSPTDENGAALKPSSEVGGDFMSESSELPTGLLLAQQQWAERRSSSALDTASQAPTAAPGTKHTMVQFVEPSSVVAHRSRERGDVPPISFTPPVLSPNNSSYSLLTTGAAGFGRQAAQQNSSSSLAVDRDGGTIASPLSITPVRTPDGEDGYSADPALRPPMFPSNSNPRGVSSIVRQMLESTEEVTEPPEDESERPVSSKHTDSVRSPPRPATPSAALPLTSAPTADDTHTTPPSAKNSRTASLRARGRSPSPSSRAVASTRAQSPPPTSRPPSRAHSPLPIARPTSPQTVPIRSRTPTAGSASAASSSPGKRSTGTGRSDGAALIHRSETPVTHDEDDGPDEY